MSEVLRPVNTISFCQPLQSCYFPFGIGMNGQMDLTETIAWQAKEEGDLEKKSFIAKRYLEIGIIHGKVTEGFGEWNHSWQS